MKLYIKNMVCERCKMVVADLLAQLDLHAHSLVLGEVDLLEQRLSSVQMDALRHRLEALGFELVDDKKSRLIERIKLAMLALVDAMIAARGGLDKPRLSDYLAQQLHQSFSQLSHLFSAVEGLTLEQYFIRLKIEKAKELLVYDELSLSEIADWLGYSSVAHLSSQFKKITGMPPSQFKQLRDARQRLALDQL